MQIASINHFKLLILIVFLAFVSKTATAGSIKIENVFVMAQPDTKKSASLFMQITNLSDQEDTLISIDAPIARFSKPHLTSVKNNKTKMLTSEEVAIPANSKVVLKESGLHIMLMGLKRPLKLGKTIRMTLNFKNGGAVIAEALIKKMKHVH